LEENQNEDDDNDSFESLYFSTNMDEEKEERQMTFKSAHSRGSSLKITRGITDEDFKANYNPNVL
jgi:hypothetical protein